LATYQNFNAATCSGHQQFKTSSPSYTGVLEYKFAPRSMAYVSARTGYLIGGFNNQVFVPGGFAQVFAPEKVKDLEVGVKSDWTLAGRPIRTNVDGFAGKYKNQQRVQNGTTSLGTTFIAVQNAGASTFYGGDLEIIYNITDELELSGSYQYIHATYDRFQAPLNIPGVNNAFVDFHGHKMSQTPDHVVNLAATYKLPMPDTYGDLSATVSWFYRSKTTGHDAPTVLGTVGPNGALQTVTTDFTQYDQLPSYSLTNFSLDWNKIMGSKVDVRFWVKNVFNKKYAVYNSNQMLQYGYATYTYGNPRELGVNVRYSF
jgi:iron complex outermembrane receptor protein